jgi:lipopolysaccharide heptosyltransferase II
MSIRNALVVLISRLLRPVFRQRKLPSSPHTIIILKPCCLGDVVLATPTITALKQRYPQANIDVAVGSWSRAVLESHPHIYQLVDSGRVGQGKYGLADVWQLAQQLRQKSYDLAVTLDRSPVVGLIPWLSGIRHRIGLDSFGRGFAHTVRVPVPEESQHEALLYLNCIAATGISILENGQSRFWPTFYPSEADKANLPPLDKMPFVIVHPAGGVNPGMQLLDKRWPPPRFAALIDRFYQHGFHVVLTGVADDLSLCQEIVSRLSGAKPQILAGKLTLGQFGALCQQAALFVGGDTGAMHLTVAVGCKTVAIFGPTDPRRYGPFAPSNQAMALWRDVALPAGGVGQRKIDHFDWENGVNVDEVWAGCQQLLHLSD